MLQNLVIAVLFGALSLWGLGMAVGTAALSMIEGRIPTLQQHQHAAIKALSNELDVWSSIPGLGDRAASLAIRVSQATVEPEQIEELGRRVEEKLRGRPASPSYWLLLAHVRFARGEPESMVMKALENSILTGRYELHVMTERVRFAIMLWPILPPDLQRQMISELAHVGGHLNRETLAELKASLASLPPEERTALATESQTRLGTTGAGWVKTLDLAEKPPS